MTDGVGPATVGWHQVPSDIITPAGTCDTALLNLGELGRLDIGPWANRVQLVEATYNGGWELPVIGAVSPPSAVLIRPDGYVAWVGERTPVGLADALTTWFGPATAA